MKEAEVKARAFAMPLTSPAYPPGPYRFVDREFMIITYRTDPDKLRAVVPEPLEVDEPLVKYEFIRMPDSTGFGDYTETGQVIPVRFRGRKGGAAAIRASLAAPNFLLKIIPHVDGSARICELVEYYLEDVTLKGAWTGPGAISLTPHALAPVAELPVLEVVSAVHLICDLTLGLGKVAHDYLASPAKRESAPKPATAGVA
jgi:acetoacetate decarboxylase